MCVGVRGSGVKELTDVYPQVTVISYVSVQQRSECSVRGRERERERERGSNVGGAEGGGVVHSQRFYFWCCLVCTRFKTHLPKIKKKFKKKRNRY